MRDLRCWDRLLVRWRAGFRLRDLLLGVRGAAALQSDDGDRGRRRKARVAGVWSCPADLESFRGDGNSSGAPRVFLIPSARDLFFNLSDFNSSSLSSSRRLVSDSWPVTLTEKIKHELKIESKAHLMEFLVRSRTD